MFKKLTFLALLTSVVCFNSCKKANNNNNNSNNSSWNWSGTAPFSAVVNGVEYSTNVNDIMCTSVGGKIMVSAGSNNDESIICNFPSDATAGSEYNMPVQAGCTYQTDQDALTSTSGKIKITMNSASMVEGYFYCDVKDFNTGTIKTISKGYFKMNK